MASLSSNRVTKAQLSAASHAGNYAAHFAFTAAVSAAHSAALSAANTAATLVLIDDPSFSATVSAAYSAINSATDSAARSALRATARSAAWAAVMADGALLEGDGVTALRRAPLWPDRKLPQFIQQVWPDFQTLFSRSAADRVWLSWYDRMLEGVWAGDEAEGFYAHLDLELLWDEEGGFANVTDWIADRLEEADEGLAISKSPIQKFTQICNVLRCVG